MCSTVHNHHEGFIPANLYMAGAPFSTAGRNKVDVARKEHNGRLAADAATANLTCAKYVAAHLGTVRPFLDPRVAALLERLGGAPAAAAAAMDVDAASTSSASSSSAASSSSSSASSSLAEGEPTSLAAVAALVAGVGVKGLTGVAAVTAAEAARAKAELERKVDAAKLPAMTLPAPLLPQPAQIEVMLLSHI